MEPPVFPDKKQLPQSADLARVLGPAKRHWDDLAAHASTAGPAASPEWKHYGNRPSFLQAALR